MHKNTVFLIVILTFLAIGLWFGKQRLQTYMSELAPAIVSPSPTPTPPAEMDALTTKVRAVFDTLTPEQRIAQLFAYPIQVSLASGSAELETPKNLPGLYTLYGTGISLARASSIVAELRAPSASADASLQPLIAIDHEGGRVQRLNGKGFTKLPSWQEWCSSLENTALSARPLALAELASSAAELREVGVNIIFAPVVDVASSSSFLKDRTCSAEPAVVSARAQEWGVTFAKQGIMPVLKHYPGIGSTTIDPHLRFSSISASQAEKNVFFEVLQRFPSWGVMLSHNGKTLPCSIDSTCVDELRQFSSETLIFSDGLEMRALTVDDASEPNLSANSLDALFAGNDVLVFGASTTVAQLQQVQVDVLKKYLSEPIFQQKIDDHVMRFLKYKQQMLTQ